jgi:hypothetical protein
MWDPVHETLEQKYPGKVAPGLQQCVYNNVSDSITEAAVPYIFSSRS